MILTILDQSDIGIPVSILTESNGKGLYNLVAGVRVTPGTGAAGSLAVQYFWLDAEDTVHALGVILAADVAGRGSASEVINIKAATDLTVQVDDAGGLVGNFTVEVRTYAARQNTEGND